MMKEMHLTEVAKRTRSMNPKKFLLWMFMVSIVMVFAALTPQAGLDSRRSGGEVMDELRRGSHDP